jgi:ribosomal protein S18 acetylase RimI-like enzyme
MNDGGIDEEWKECVEETNKLLVVAFGKGNDPYYWDATEMVKGYIDGKLVCICGVEYDYEDNTKALIDSICASPQNRGYGTSLIQYIIKYLNDSGVKNIYLKIDKNEKADRLKKFYSQFGFSEVKKVYDDYFFEYHSHDEYVMYRSSSVNSV